MYRSPCSDTVTFKSYCAPTEFSRCVGIRLLITNWVLTTCPGVLGADKEASLLCGASVQLWKIFCGSWARAHVLSVRFQTSSPTSLGFIFCALWNLSVKPIWLDISRNPTYYNISKEGGGQYLTMGFHLWGGRTKWTVQFREELKAAEGNSKAALKPSVFLVSDCSWCAFNSSLTRFSFSTKDMLPPLTPSVAETLSQLVIVWPSLTVRNLGVGNPGCKLACQEWSMISKIYGIYKIKRYFWLR